MTTMDPFANYQAVKKLLYQTHHATELTFYSPLMTVLENYVTRPCEGGNWELGPQQHHLLIAGEDVGPMRNVNTTRLLHLAQPAPFGIKDQTVMDETVRKALQIPASDIKIEKHDAFIAKLLKQDIHRLCPPGHKFRAEFYKMHLYRPGDFFVAHKNTVHANNHYATVVVVLPGEFTGGQLNVQDEVFFTSSSTSHVQYCAFFTDCIHQVQTVTSGVRVTLQYDLYLEPKDKDKEEEEEEEKEVKEEEEDEIDAENYPMEDEDTIQSNAAALQVTPAHIPFDILMKAVAEEFQSIPEPPRMDQSQKRLFDLAPQFGILLRHSYALAATSIRYLKGVDLQLYQHLTTKYHCTMAPCVVYQCQEELMSMKHSFVVYRFDRKTLGRMQTPRRVIASRKFFHGLQLDHEAGAEFTGNESAPEQFWYSTAMLIVQEQDPTTKRAKT
jgi:hypothetical protein